MSTEAEQLLSRFDFERVAAEFHSRGWTYGMNLPLLGMTEHTPDAAELFALGRRLLASVIDCPEPNYFIETGRLWAGRVGGKLALQCTGALAVAVGSIPEKVQPATPTGGRPHGD